MELGRRQQDRCNPCHICGQTGYWANQCPQRNRNQGTSHPPQQPQRGNAPRGNLRGQGGRRQGRGGSRQSGNRPPNNYQWAPCPNPQQQQQCCQDGNIPPSQQIRTMWEQLDGSSRLDMVTELAKQI
jgi:hypothetical protein